MRFNVAQLIGHLDSALEPLCPLEGAVTLMRTSQGILVTGMLRTRLRVECRRCLEPFAADAQIDLEEEFLPVVRIGSAPVDDVPPEERDDSLLIDGDHILDLSEVVRQGLWLTLPSERICRPDCAGLCPRCGGNRNLGECQCDAEPIDPRWAALQMLLSNEPDSQERSD
jgi:uncharacterized protein